MKKLLAMLLCILMVVGLVSCGGNAETSKENSIGNEISSDASNETRAETSGGSAVKRTRALWVFKDSWQTASEKPALK